MRKTTTEQIENVQSEIQKLKEREKTLLQKHKTEERRERTHRLCKRGGYLESKMPELKTLTDEQFETFTEKTLLTQHSRRILADMTAEPSAQKPAEVQQENGRGKDGNGANGGSATS